MHVITFGRRAAATVVLMAASAVAVAPTAATAVAPAAISSGTAQHPAASKSPYRQLLGTVTASTYLEASTPTAGTYAIEYDVTGTAFFDTYVDNTELGYVGGSSGVYLTRPITLSAGGHLVQVVGPEGSGSAQVYIVQTSKHRSHTPVKS